LAGKTVVRGIGYRVAADVAAADHPTVGAKISAVTEPRSLVFDTTADAADQIAASVLGPGIVERTSRIGAVKFDLVEGPDRLRRLGGEGSRPRGPDGWLERQMTLRKPLLSTGPERGCDDTPGHGFGLAV
jgi:hypothetical protein